MSVAHKTRFAPVTAQHVKPTNQHYHTYLLGICTSNGALYDCTAEVSLKDYFLEWRVTDVHSGQTTNFPTFSQAPTSPSPETPQAPRPPAYDHQPVCWFLNVLMCACHCTSGPCRYQRRLYDNRPRDRPLLLPSSGGVCRRQLRLRLVTLRLCMASLH